MFLEKAIGFISSHQDNSSAEGILKYIYEYINSKSVSIPIERIVCNIVDELLVQNDRTTVFKQLTLDNGITEPPILSIFKSPRLPNIPVEKSNSR